MRYEIELSFDDRVLVGAELESLPRAKKQAWVLKRIYPEAKIRVRVSRRPPPSPPTEALRLEEILFDEPEKTTLQRPTAELLAAGRRERRDTLVDLEPPTQSLSLDELVFDAEDTAVERPWHLGQFAQRRRHSSDEHPRFD